MKKHFLLILIIICQMWLLSSCDEKNAGESIIHNEVQGNVTYDTTNIYYISEKKEIIKRDRITQQEQSLNISDVSFIKIQDGYLYYLIKTTEKNVLYTLNLTSNMIKELYSFSKEVDSFKIYQNTAYFLNGSQLYQLDLLELTEKQLPIQCYMEFEVIGNYVYYQEILAGETEKLSETFQLENKQYKIVCYDLDTKEKKDIVPVSETEFRDFIQVNNTLIYNRIGESVHQVNSAGQDKQVVEANVSGLFGDDNNFIYYSDYSASKAYGYNLVSKQKHVICEITGINILLGVTPDEVYISELSSQLIYQNVWLNRVDNNTQ